MSTNDRAKGGVGDGGESAASDSADASSIIRVPCPGRAHQHGGECLICDAENDGTISVVLTQLEHEALLRASQGLAVDSRLSPRLVRFGLLETVAGCMLPTERGYALLGDPRVRAS